MNRFAVMLLICATLLSACTSSKWVRAPIDKQYDFIITLEQQQDEGAIITQKYQHPFAIELADLKKLLAELTYLERVGLTNKDTEYSVFQADEVERLAPALMEALTKADNSQRIRFTSYSQGKALIFSVSQKTEAVIFIDPDRRLNIAFNYINSKREPSDTTALYHRHSNFDPLKISAADATLTLPAAYAEFHTFESGQQAPLWINIDLEKLKSSHTTATDLGVKKAEIIQPPVAPQTSMTAVPAASNAVKESEVLLEENIKNKLKFLKELFDEGLISETDYNSKKTGLLKEIY